MSGVVIDIDCWEAEGCVTSVCLEFRQRTRDSQWAAGPEQTNPPPNCSPPFTLNVCWSLFCLAFIQSFYCPPFVLSSHSLSPWRELAFRHATLSGFLLILWISSKARLRKRGFRGKKKRGDISSFLSLSLSGTHPCFHSQRRAESRSWPDRQQGWFHVTGTGAKGPESYSLHFLLIAHRSTVVCSPDHSRQRRRLPARVLLHPEDPPLLLLLTYISQDRTPLNLELF